MKAFSTSSLLLLLLCELLGICWSLLLMTAEMRCVYSRETLLALRHSGVSSPPPELIPELLATDEPNRRASHRRKRGKRGGFLRKDQWWRHLCLHK